MICNAKKGISAKQIERDLKLSYKTAWSMMHRIRRAMRDTAFLHKLTGIVEADETYIGGKYKNQRRWRRAGRKPKMVTGGMGKMVVLGALQRDGEIRLQFAQNAKKRAISRFIKASVSKDVEMLVTDEYKPYVHLRSEYRHERICHEYEYVRGQVHTNGIESFWAILKRGITGVYHKVSADYLPLYLAEFSYRFNNRKNQGELFTKVLRNGLLTDQAVMVQSA